MKRLIAFLSICLIGSPLFATETPFDGVSSIISTTTATLYSYPCYLDGAAISNASTTEQTVIVYDGSTEVYRCIISTRSNAYDINIKKKINTSLKATASPSNIDGTVRLYLGIK